MARINSGVDPAFLSDQHLIAESVEITMVTGGLRVNGYKIKGKVPDNYTLGKGHINFFKDKLVYLTQRLHEVNKQIAARGYSSGTHIDLDEYPAQFHNDWSPTWDATALVRARIASRLMSPKSGRKGSEFHRYKGKVLGAAMDQFCADMLDSPLFYV